MSAYPPTVDDCKAFAATIPEANIATGFDWAGVIAGVVNVFEDCTNRPGFIRDGSTVSVLYNPPDGREGHLRLYIDDFYEIDSVYVQVTTTNPAGKLLALDTEYALKPDNPSGRPWPYESIEFYAYLGWTPRSVKVTGKRGYQAACPGDVLTAIKSEVAAIALTNSVGTAGSIKQQRLGDRSIAYETSHTTIDRLHEAFYSAVTKYTKIGAV